MRKKILIKIAVIISILFISGCFSNSDKSKDGRVRINVYSESSTGTEIKIWVEGKSGELVNGALVNVISPANTLVTADYDYKNNYYYCKYSSISQGNYKDVSQHFPQNIR